MNAKTGLKLVAFVFIIYSGCAENQFPQTEAQAADRIDQLLMLCDQNTEDEEYQSCSDNLDKILDICGKFASQEYRIWNITDRKQYMLQLLGKFDEALTVAFELEEMSKQLRKRESPWNYLKIADSYFGLHDLDNTLEWIGKAVYERGFRKYRFFERDKYAVLQSDQRLQKMIRDMKDAIGLQHPAKDIAISLLDGEKFELASQKGKVVLIDFWDVACPPCIRAMPELRDLYVDFGSKGLELVGISLDTDKELLEGFLEKNDIPWKIACSYDGWKDETAILYGINATPSTWLIDRNGILQHQNLSGAELRSAVEELIGE